MKVLILSCHTDDIELAAGGMVSQLDNVYGYIPTLEYVYDSTYCTKQECLNAWEILGIEMVSGVSTTHHARDINRQQLLDDLVKLRNEIKPDLVITHGEMDTHQSHQVVYNESLRAFKNCSMLGYSHTWNCQKGTKNSWFYSLADEAVNLKLKALSCYKSQIAKNLFYFDNKYQLTKMENNGKEINKPFAEAFEVIRWIQ